MSILSRATHSLLKTAYTHTNKQTVPLFKNISYREILTQPIYGAEGLVKTKGLGYVEAHTARTLAYMGTIAHQLPLQLLKGLINSILHPIRSYKTLEKTTFKAMERFFSKETLTTAQVGVKNSVADLAKQGQDIQKATTNFLNKFKDSIPKNIEGTETLIKDHLQTFKTAITDASGNLTKNGQALSQSISDTANRVVGALNIKGDGVNKARKAMIEMLDKLAKSLTPSVQKAGGATKQTVNTVV